METSPKACSFNEVEVRFVCLIGRHSSFCYLECTGQLRERTRLCAKKLIRENCFAKRKFIQISSLLCKRNGC